VVHVVQPGETAWRISKRYGIGVDELLRANAIADVNDIAIGTRLRIPAPLDPAGARPVPRPGDSPVVIDRSVRELGLRFGWPVRGTLNSRFGGQRGGSHDGIDIGGRKGAPVRASEAGRVTYSGSLGDYGNVVIVKHVGQWSTVYAHNRRNRVNKGQFVERGDLVADLGDSGSASGPHLHFEIRKGQTPVDPLRYLP
jgi:lipoprotein NlpD